MATQNEHGEKSTSDTGSMTTREAGQKGGERVRELVEEGKQREQKYGQQSGATFGERVEQTPHHRDDDLEAE